MKYTRIIVRCSSSHRGLQAAFKVNGKIFRRNKKKLTEVFFFFLSPRSHKLAHQIELKLSSTGCDL